MISFFANLFGYVLNFLYKMCQNYGLAIILFSVIVKLLMLPLSIKQQKTLKKSAKIQEEMKQIQFKYKSDPEKMNQEVMSLYKRENMSPFSGCLSSIIQIVLLFSVFYLVRSPLTYMKKIDTGVIEQMKSIVQQENADNRYQEIAIIQYVKNFESQSSVKKDEDSIQSDNENQEQVSEEKDKFDVSKYKDVLNINMDFLGIDLSKVPTQDLSDWKALVIPVLYVISSFVSMRLTTSMQNNKKKSKMITDGNEGKKEETYDAMADTNKMMSWFMPIMSISIACVAPLGLALYWLMNNLLMILERVMFDRIFKDDDKKEEAIRNV